MLTNCSQLGISIHAPTRGATKLENICIRKYKISIHAPTRGATLSTVIVLNILEFQSTLPREERRMPREPYVSYPYFNPRSHERSDMRCSSSVGSSGIFQSTLPREERLRAGSKSFSVAANFNPRSHERSDFLLYAFCYILRNFNPRSHERSDSNIAQKICLFLYNTDNKYIIR